jgi:hypothetical protein
MANNQNFSPLSFSFVAPNQQERLVLELNDPTIEQKYQATIQNRLTLRTSTKTTMVNTGRGLTECLEISDGVKLAPDDVYVQGEYGLYLLQGGVSNSINTMAWELPSKNLITGQVDSSNTKAIEAYENSGVKAATFVAPLFQTSIKRKFALLRRL